MHKPPGGGHAANGVALAHSSSPSRIPATSQTFQPARHSLPRAPERLLERLLIEPPRQHGRACRGPKEGPSARPIYYARWGREMAVAQMVAVSLDCRVPPAAACQPACTVSLLVHERASDCQAMLARLASHADGRPLTAVLEQQQQFTRRGGSSHKQRPGQIREPREGWSKPLPRAATAAAAGAVSGPQSEAEAAELYALSRVGQRKQVRAEPCLIAAPHWCTPASAIGAACTVLLYSFYSLHTCTCLGVTPQCGHNKRQSLSSTKQFLGQAC